MIMNTLHDMIKEKENNTKATINGDKEGFLVIESFVDTEPSETRERGALPKNFGGYLYPIYIRVAVQVMPTPLPDFQTFLQPCDC